MLKDIVDDQNAVQGHIRTGNGRETDSHHVVLAAKQSEGHQGSKTRVSRRVIMKRMNLCATELCMRIRA